MASSVNLHPERRHKLEETGTSKFFEHSTSQAKIELREGQTKRERIDDDSDDTPLQRPMRQMRLDFSNGSMGTKKPFKNPLSRSDDARLSLAEVAEETVTLLPGLLQTRPDVKTDAYLYQRENLDQKFNPGLPAIKVRVISSDTIDAALDLQSRAVSSAGKPVVILNMANAKSAGGGWKYGALAQEEAICYRSSLSFTLKRKFYPIPDDAAIYSPQVLVIRDSIKSGHQIVDCTEPRKLNVISVVSCAAVCQPSLRTDPKSGVKTYALNKDKRLMLEKMRVILRTAIRNRHRRIVLGALGCGAFGNPTMEVAALWKTVLKEREFSGGWWEDVVFAVLGDSKADSNFKVFFDELDGLILD